MKRKFFGLTLFLLLILPILSMAFKPVADISLTAEKIALWAGVFVSWLFSYFPGLNTWYAAKSEDFKKLFMIGVLTFVVVGLYTLMCFNIITIANMTCSTDSLVTIAYLWIIAIVTNQSIYKITPQLNAVKEAKISG
jgi:hypothetical protein